jgi:hypothetical protein
LADLFSSLFSKLLGARRGALAAALGITFYTLLRTDQSGWIEVSTDGEQMWVEVQRK